MFSRLLSASTMGVNAFLVEVETHLEAGLPAFSVVGLPDSAVREARERVSAAIKNSGLGFPIKKITVNLAPADVRKEGSAFDLPLAIGVLHSFGQIDAAAELPATSVIIGELALDGTVRPVRGALSIAMEAAKQGVRHILLPAANAGEAAMVSSIRAYPIARLRDAVDFLNGERDIPALEVDTQTLFAVGRTAALDLADVKGQEAAKRAMEVSAAGGHNLIMVGPPGSGKTMLAKRMPSILPPLTLDEAMDSTRIHSVAGLLPENQALVVTRPFRAPHHTISDAALVGGGVGFVRPGEISLAHHGVLFLDELPEFARNVLEVLRQPLEDKHITISRTRMTVEYPANFMLVCSMNPCPCGNFGNPLQSCTCAPQQIQRYMAKVSGPLLDRIDIHVDVPSVKYQELASGRNGESSEDLRGRVLQARRVQAQRFHAHPGIHKNADMGAAEIRAYCALDDEGKALLKMAMTRLGFSARAFDRIRKLARTIADLAGADQIQPLHVGEAIQYRSLDRQYWNA